MNAAIYARISRDAEEEGLGVLRQEEDCRALADKLGLTVGKVFIDNDISASTLSKKPRPAYADMLDRVRDREFTHILSYSSSRLTRRPRELEDLIQLHEETGVLIKTIASGDDDLSTANGRMVARIKASVDAAEAEVASERIRRAAKQYAEMGKVKKSRYRTFGYTDDFEVIEEEAELIRDAFKRICAGHSIMSVTHHWRELGVDMGRGTLIYISTVKGVLKRPLYAGLRQYQGEIVGKANVEPIIDEATYYAAQTILADKSRPGQNARRYLLSGMITCGNCGFPMHGTLGYMSANDGRRYGYLCSTAIGGCGGMNVNGVNVDKIVLGIVRQRLIVQASSFIRPAEGSVEALQAKIDAKDAEIKHLQAEIANGNIAVYDATPILKDLSQTKRALQREQASEVVEEEPSFWQWEDFMQAPLSGQRATVRRCIKAVVIHRAASKQWNPIRIEVVNANGKSYRITGNLFAQYRHIEPRKFIPTYHDFLV